MTLLPILHSSGHLVEEEAALELLFIGELIVRSEHISKATSSKLQAKPSHSSSHLVEEETAEDVGGVGGGGRQRLVHRPPDRPALALVVRVRRPGDERRWGGTV